MGNHFLKWMNYMHCIKVTIPVPFKITAELPQDCINATKWFLTNNQKYKYNHKLPPACTELHTSLVSFFRINRKIKHFNKHFFESFSIWKSWKNTWKDIQAIFAEYARKNSKSQDLFFLQIIYYRAIDKISKFYFQ